MPIIEGADLSSVSTERELIPEGEYLFTITDQEMSDDNSTLIIKRRIEEAPDSKFVGQESWDFINLVQNDGKKNEIGLQTIKKYLEAVFGKGSPESNSNDTDPLTGQQVRIYISHRSAKGSDKQYLNNKKFLAV